ncbi:MAG TPA: shikimate kinase [Gemmatimonadaceae bacterium]|jgi:shikimate kinase|nr:shikimate kinase [Gemmatimonadaceae bacterium]
MTHRHLVLVGLPGAGKSTVGLAVAGRLGRPFVDLDVEIEARGGRSVAELFRVKGEPEFRRLEHAATAALVGSAPAVIAPGGGWMTQAETVKLLRPHALLVYLRVSPEAALRRLGPGVATRPLLAGSDPAAALRSLEAARAPVYLTADRVLDTEALDLQDVVESLVQMASADL